MSSDLGDLGKAAIEYAQRGWLIYPQKVDKSPITAHGIGDATADLRLVYAWWREWPDANIALASGASGLVVVDADLKKDVEASLLIDHLIDFKVSQLSRPLREWYQQQQDILNLLPAAPK